MNKGDGKPPAHQLGVSFSLHRCSELGLNKQAVLSETLSQLGFKRLRLMSYWNIHEPRPGIYNFDELDWQMDLLARYNAQASLCLGRRQPRWPECHMPAWAQKLPKEAWQKALLAYIEAVMNRYNRHPALASWQLENEALLKSFGYCPDQDYSQERLNAEYDLVKKLDPHHMVIMTLSDSWGLPWRTPRPDCYAFSLYRQTHSKGKARKSRRGPWFYRLRASLIFMLTRRPAFIHELQAEPWPAGAITETPLEDQLKLLNADHLLENINFAKKVSSLPIYLWGLEWWYWLKTQHQAPDIWNAIQHTMTDQNSA